MNEPNFVTLKAHTTKRTCLLIAYQHTTYRCLCCGRCPDRGGGGYNGWKTNPNVFDPQRNFKTNRRNRLKYSVRFHISEKQTQMYRSCQRAGGRWPIRLRWVPANPVRRTMLG